MPWRGVAPVQLVIAFIGAVLVLCVCGMILLSVIAVLQHEDVGSTIPNQLATVSVASMTAMAGLLAPNTGLLTNGRTARRAEAAGQAAAAAIVASDTDAEAAAETLAAEGDDENGRHKA